MNRDRRRLALFTIRPRIAVHAHIGPVTLTRDGQLSRPTARTRRMTIKNTSEGETEAGTEPASANGTARQEAMKPLTIMVADEVLKRLKIIAIVKETSVSELVAEAAAGVVRRELKKALAKVSVE